MILIYGKPMNKLSRRLFFVKNYKIAPFNSYFTTKVPQESVTLTINEDKLPAITKIDQTTIELLERLSLVDFANKRGIEQLEEAIQFADRIRAIDTEDVEPLVTVLDMSLYLRDDGVTDGNCCKEVMSNASVTEDDYFVAPLGNIPLISSEKLLTEKMND